MVSFRTVAALALAATVSALPASYRLSPRQLKYYDLAVRQNNQAQAQGLTDPDILSFALFLEQLEFTFYKEGFAKFPESDFAALGLNQQQISDLKTIRDTEEQHVVLLQSALAQAGIQPIQTCTYNFNFTDAKGMVATASILENVGVSAYLGAAGLITDKKILGTAASIVTVESRHQSSIRAFSGIMAVPQAFDVPLGPRAVFSMASGFVKQCPQNLAIQAFPALTMVGGETPKIGSSVRVQAASGSSEAKHCAFTSGSAPVGTTVFANFTENEGCVVPQGVAGVAYVSLTKEAPLDGTLSDDNIVAGPMPMTIT